MKTPRGASESSTTSDNTSEFIDIVKRYDVVYNTHNPDYKNVEVKMKVWSQIAEEIGLSVDASKRKWKNLRDSYTKYLRSFRTGTKTSKKYQYWAHADHMEFLKPYQGPGRNSVNTNNKTNEDEDTECDLGYQVLVKTTTSSDDDLKITITTNPATAAVTTPTVATITPAMSTGAATTTTATTTSLTLTTSSAAAISTLAATPINTTSSAAAVVLPIPSLPAVPLPPPMTAASGMLAKPPLTPIVTMPTTISLPALPPHITGPQLFPLTPLNAAKLPMPTCSTASSVGCLIIEPQLFASADTFKKELTAPAAALGLFHNITSQACAPATSSRANPPLITKIRRVQPSPQTAAINLSFSATGGGSAASSTNSNQPPPAKQRKTGERNDLDIAAVLQANRDLDANTLFFLSLARSVRAMPTKFQSLAKMRCMRIVSDIELELDNVNDCNGPPQEEGGMGAANLKYCSIDTPPPPPPADGTIFMHPTLAVANDAATEHFVYVMSPSRVESMIDISSDEEATMNGGN